MSIIPRNSMFDLDLFFERPWMPFRNSENQNSHFSPRVDVSENKQGYTISAELPGVEKNDISVSLENGVLSIQAESKQENKEEKDGEVIRQERRFGRYVRSFDLGPTVQESDISAQFKNGVLTLQAPRVEKASHEKKLISVK